MKKNTIIIGESASISKEIIEKFGIVVVPFVIDWPEMDKLEGNNIFEKMKDAEKKGIKTTPKTSQPSMGIFKKAFDEALKESEAVICITISSGISGTYNSALQAKKMLKENDQKRVFILDSLNADASESLIAIRAGELNMEEKSGEEIFEEIQRIVPKVTLLGMINSPKWLEAGGRISHPLGVIFTQMQKMGMRPILSVKDGLIKPANLKMQAKDTANALFKQAEELIKKDDHCHLAISHADSLEEAQKLEKLIKEKYPEVKINFISLTSAVIGSHIGPGLLIACLIEK